MKRIRLCLISLFFLFGAVALPSQLAQAAPLATPLSADMVSPKTSVDQCLTVNGTDVTTAPGLVMDTCRGTPQQMWTHDSVAGKWQSGLDTNYCIAHQTTNSWILVVLPCTDAKALVLQPDSQNSSVYVEGTLALDLASNGVLGLYPVHRGTNQQFSWLQPDLDVVTAQGCTISYPLAASDTATYNRELACDHVAKIQSPYVVPTAAQRDPSLFPGVVPAGTPAVTNRTFAFDLLFQDNSYARIAVAPRNWKSTGLYAPATQVVSITVSNATAADLTQVYAQIGVHTDVLQPTSSNVANTGQFLRYPNVVTKIRLQPGLNQVRSPYGGLIILTSNASVNKTINVQIDNAVEAPYFLAGQTTEAEWLARRDAAAPWGEIESDLAVLSVAASQLKLLSYADVSAMAQFYSNVARYHNEVSGMSDSAAVPHRFPQGQQRFVTDKQISLGSAHSGYPTMFFDSYLLGTPSDTILRASDTDWGMFHEFGHNYQMGAWSYVYGVETTVNIFSLHALETFFGTNRLVNENTYAAAIAILNDPAVTNKWTTLDNFQRLVFIDQLRLGFPSLDWNFWEEVMRRYRDMTSTEYDAINTDPLKYDKLMTIACDVTNTNLTPHFDAWTVPVSQTAKDYCATKPALTRQIWEIDNAKPLWYHPGTGSGSFLREYWTGISGSSLTNLTSNAAYPNNPTGSSLVTTGLEGTQNFADSYGERLRGFLSPPVTGNYRFWLSGDDTAQLLLSTDQDPSHASPIVTLAASSGYHNFDNFNLTVQRSAEIPLVAGQKYYIEVLHKEGSGGDSVSVAWNIPATAGLPGEVRKIIDAQYLSPYAGDLALRKTLATGQAATIVPGQDVTFQITVFNQGAAAAHNVQIMDTLPNSFTLSAADTNGWLTGYRYVQFEADSEVGATSGTTTVGELGLLGAGGAALAKTGWVASANSQETAAENTPASNAIDGNTTTFWSSKWNGSTTPFPHTLTIDTGAPRTLTGFTYLPRQSSANGRVGNYKFFVSVDGTTWVQVASGTFANTSTEKTVSFTPPTSQQAVNTISGPIAPGASASVNIILRANGATAVGAYNNFAEIVTALDSVNTNLRDADSTPDTNRNNDTLVDDTLDNSGGDEDDSDLAAVQVAASAAVNPSVSQTSVTAGAYNGTPVSCGATPLPSQTVTTVVHNNAATAFSGLFFKVKTLDYKVAQAGGVQPKLCNADTPGGGVDATLTVAGSLAGGGNLTQPFVVGLPVRAAYRFFVDLYSAGATAATADGASPELYLGSFVYEFDADNQLIGSQNRLFLPLVVR